MRVGIFISGTGTNMKKILEKYREGYFSAVSDISFVLSDKTSAQGLKTASNLGFKTIPVPRKPGEKRLDHENRILEAIRPFNVKIIVLAGFMRILSPKFIKKFSGYIINIHPSLLPAFPGVNAQKQAFDAGVKISGCTTHFVDETLDGGPVILQRAVKRNDSDTLESFSKRILVEEHKLLPETLDIVTAEKFRDYCGYIKVEKHK
ncbi:MAG: phosphoribosylglycinamide formyltransferase [bacterium]